MSDSAYLAGYLPCYSCGGTQGPLVSLEFYGNRITKKVIVQCECGNITDVHTEYREAVEDEEE